MRIHQGLQKVLYLGLILLIGYGLYLCAFSVINGEVYFSNDVARDFLLLQELDLKKIVFIGPRSNVPGLFYGPVWSYINYPAYLIGQGNPVTVAWFWIILAVIFAITSFLIAKKLFGTNPAIAYILLIISVMPFNINGIIHAEAMIFFVPVWFFSIYKYIETKKALYLGIHFFAFSILAQLNTGVGIPLFILSAPLVIWFIIKNKLTKHLLLFLLIPLFLVNMIIFDLRHNLQMTKAIISSGGDTRLFVPLKTLIENRVQSTVSLLFLPKRSFGLINFVIFIPVVVFTYLKIRNNKKERKIYFLFAYYYLGYMLLSFMSRGVILYHHVYFLIPLTALWIVSFLKGKYKFIFLPLIAIVIVMNYQDAVKFTESLKGSIGNNSKSWVALSKASQVVIDRQKGREFGYFVFSPDSFAYQPRYAMNYNFRAAGTLDFEYKKMPVTYVIAAPHPVDDIYMTHAWWRKNSVNISKNPVWSKKLPSGYIIEEYHLTPQEQKVPHDKNIELGIHFR